jgi:glyceraldehyde 3-phosphate dehydrogenase
MSKKRIAINGFGRIGRLTFRNLVENPNVEVVAINDLTSNDILAHLLKYDSAHGNFNGDVSSTDTHLIVNGKEILATAIKNPEELPWSANNVDVVLECTGIFRSREKAGLHLKAGAKKVLISAPAAGKDVPTVVLGVNDGAINDTMDIISNASCTTNCLAPLVKVIKENWGFVFGSLTTTHAYTADQNLQDSPHKDLRRARAAAYNIVPTSTGAAEAVGEVLDGVSGRMFAIALRVPTITGSLVEFNCMVEKEVTKAEINSTFKKYADGPMKGILQYTEDPIVSSDIVGNKHSSIFDSELTDVLDGKFIKVCAWYDKEAGYSARLADLAVRI